MTVYVGRVQLRLLLVLFAAFSGFNFASADDLLARRAGLDRKFDDLLNQRADVLEAQGQREQGRALRAWRIPRQPGRTYLFLPTANGAAAVDDAESRKLLRFYAHHLFNLAKAALEADRSDLAYQWAHEVLRADPQHELARAVVNVKDDKPIKAKETPAGWEIETEHFEITTNHSQAAGEEVGARLEELHAVWRQLFADYWFTPAELARRFEGKASRIVEPDHKVMLFATKDQYVDFLKQDEPGIAVSLGYYAEKPRTAFFFVGDERTIATQFHEATHQLFHERLRRGRPAGLSDNFWVVEGVATYMESLRKGKGYYTVGGPGAYRLQFARYRALSEQFYVPLADFVALGREEMKAQGENLPRLYSQAAGLAHFFMDGAHGKYRQAFVKYLDAVYRDKADAATLAALTGKTYAELDKEYLAFLRSDDHDLASLIPGEHVPRLYLGRTRVTDAAMPHIAQVVGLERLDVGYCPISDAGLKKLPVGESVVQLNLEHTHITDASAPHIARFSGLRELDLSGCRISDAALAHVARLNDLEVLWLTDTSVSDAGLEHLHGLKKLKFVDIAGSDVTAAGWEELKRAVPRLATE